MVFISTAMVDGGARKSITNPILKMDDHSSIDFDKLNASGEPMGPDYFPKEAWGNYKQLPHLFYGGGFWFVSAKAAAVMRQFDLGAGALYPVDVFAKDRVTPLGEGWFCINFGNRKSAFLAGESSRVRPQVGGRWPNFSTLKDDEFAITASALVGPDIWVDPQLWDSIFLSAPLGKALKKAKAANGFYLRSCRVVG